MLIPIASSPLLLVNAQPVKVSQGSTYSELLSVIEEMSREIRPTYAGSKSAMERLKRGEIFAFIFHVAMLLLGLHVWPTPADWRSFQFAASKTLTQLG